MRIHMTWKKCTLCTQTARSVFMSVFRSLARSLDFSVCVYVCVYLYFGVRACSQYFCYLEQTKRKTEDD